PRTTNPPETRPGLQREGPRLQRVFACAVSPPRAPAIPGRSAGPAENPARRLQSNPAAAPATPDTFCETPWRPAATWDVAWISPRRAARRKRWPKPAPLMPATPPAAIASEDRGKAKHEPAARGGRSRQRKNPQSAARHALGAALP